MNNKRTQIQSKRISLLCPAFQGRQGNQDRVLVLTLSLIQGRQYSVQRGPDQVFMVAEKVMDGNRKNAKWE